MSNPRKLKLTGFLVFAMAIAAMLFSSGCSSDPYSVDYGNSVYNPRPAVQPTTYYSSGFYDPWYHRPYYGRPYYGRPGYGW